MTKQLLQRALDALETFRFTPEDQLESEEIADADSIIAELRKELDKPEAEMIAWESTTNAYTKYITQSRYAHFRPEIQRWYKPFCPQCHADTEALRAELERIKAAIGNEQLAQFIEKHGNPVPIVQELEAKDKALRVALEAIEPPALGS